MNQTIKIRNEADCTVIDIEGTIGVSEEWQFENPASRVATYERFKECVSQIADIDNARIVVNIRSTGGDVNDALLIYEALRNTGAHITTRCYGYTASAATIVAQAASEGCRQVAPSSLYLIHNSLCSAEGNADELQQEIEMLRQTDRRLAEIYATRANRSVEEITALMAENGGRGRWLAPEEVIANGLADTLTEASSTAASSTATSAQPTATTDSFARRAMQRVHALLKAVGIEGAEKIGIEEDINYIPRTENITPATSEPHTSPITLDERQRSVEPTPLKEVDDPMLVDGHTSPRSSAYDEDARTIRQRY